jgi:hypothetical protein
MRPSRWILLLVPLVMLVAGQENSNKAETKPRGRLTLPEDAQRIDAYSHSYTDKDGKSWIYRQTPFGLVRYQDESKAGAAAAAQKKAEQPTGASRAPARSTAGASSTASASSQVAPAPPPGLRAFDEGDSVRFEKDGPFGKYTWVRKKDQLTAQERSAWEAARKSPPKAKEAKQE